MLKLIIGDEKGKAQNATIPIRWCVDKNTLERLKENEVLNPHLLLVNVVHQKEVQRLLIPLEQALEYVQFRTPGRNTIYATIIWAKDGKSLWESFIKRENNRYATDVLNRDGTFYYNEDYQGFGFTTTEFAEMDVVIPQEMFAKAPPRWLEKWVNLWYETKTRDQCHFRKRIPAAFTIQPPLVLLWLILRSLIGIAAAMFFILLLGLRGINLEPIIHPWKQRLRWVWNDKKNTIFYRDWRDKNGQEQIQFYLLPLIPIIPLLIFGLCFLIFSGPRLTPNPAEIAFYQSLYMTMIITGSLVIFFAIVDAIVHPLSYIPEKELAVKREEYKRKYDEFGYLLCDGGVLPDLKALPPKRRTIHLRFMNLKAQVCKPFAR